MCSTVPPKQFALPLALGDVGDESAMLVRSDLPPIFDAGDPASFPAALPSPPLPVLPGMEPPFGNEEDDFLRRIYGLNRLANNRARDLALLME